MLKSAVSLSNCYVCVLPVFQQIIHIQGTMTVSITTVITKVHKGSVKLIQWVKNSPIVYSVCQICSNLSFSKPASKNGEIGSLNLESHFWSALKISFSASYRTIFFYKTLKYFFSVKITKFDLSKEIQHHFTFSI